MYLIFTLLPAQAAASQLVACLTSELNWRPHALINKV